MSFYLFSGDGVKVFFLHSFRLHHTTSPAHTGTLQQITMITAEMIQA